MGLFDRFPWGTKRRASDPGAGSVAVTPDDDTDLAERILSLYVTAGGDVCFVGVDGAEDTWTVPDNFLIPVAMTRVKSTGTTATGLHGIR